MWPAIPRNPTKHDPPRGPTPAYGNLIRARLARGGPADVQRALELAQLFASAHPRDAEPKYTVGVVLMQLGRIAEAAASFEETLGVDPTHRSALINGAHTVTQLRAEAGHGSALSLRERRCRAVGWVMGWLGCGLEPWAGSGMAG